MKTIKCPKCGKEFTINISHSISSDGEIFLLEKIRLNIQMKFILK